MPMGFERRHSLPLERAESRWAAAVSCMLTIHATASYYLYLSTFQAAY